VLLGTPPSVIHPPSSCTDYTSLLPGQSLASGQRIQSPNHRYMLLMQSDGNLVLSQNTKAGTTATWSSGTSVAGSTATMTTGGELTVSSGGSTSWSAGPADPQSYLALQDDGNLVIYTAAGGAVWSSGTQRSACAS